MWYLKNFTSTNYPKDTNVWEIHDRYANTEDFEGLHRALSSFGKKVKLAFINLQIMPEYAFNSVHDIEFDVILEVATAIEDCAFYQSSLTNISLLKIECIGEESFTACQIKQLCIPSIRKISKSAFSWCRNLEKVDIPNVSLIEEGAFYHCDRLERVNMPLVEIIEDQAFEEASLSMVNTIPNVKEIGHSALRGAKFTTISLPKVREIGAKSFSRCGYLKEIKMPANVKRDGSAFDLSNIDGKLLENWIKL